MVRYRLLTFGNKLIPFCLRDVENPISWAHSVGISINASTVTRKQMASFYQMLSKSHASGNFKPRVEGSKCQSIERKLRSCSSYKIEKSSETLRYVYVLSLEE